MSAELLDIGETAFAQMRFDPVGAVPCVGVMGRVRANRGNAQQLKQAIGGSRKIQIQRHDGSVSVITQNLFVPVDA